MDFVHSRRCRSSGRAHRFMNEYVYPNEKTHHEQIGATDNRWKRPRSWTSSKGEARGFGTSSCRNPSTGQGSQPGLHMRESWSRSLIAPEVFTATPDTGTWRSCPLREPRSRRE